MSKKKFLKKLKDYSCRIKNLYKGRSRVSEEDTKIKFIIELFRILGWNSLKPEMEFEFPIDSDNHVDIALYIQGYKKPKILIEAKALRRDLRRGMQLSGYLKKTKVPLGIYTNGRALKLVSIYKVRDDARPQVLLYFEKPEYFISYSDVLSMLSKKMINAEILDEFAEAFHSGEYKLWKEKQKSKLATKSLRHLEFARYFLKKSS